jgi:hypothetical protein
MSEANVIVQLFNIKWKDICHILPSLAKKGVTHIQLSPVQKHCIHFFNSIWYRLYQPTGKKIGNSLGDEKDLQELVVSQTNNIYKA